MDYLIANSTAGSGKDGRYWSHRLAQAGVKPVGDVVTDAEQLPQLTDQDRLVVAGGDGTLSRFVPLCIENGCTLGVLPSGTGNDFARGLGIPLDDAAACDVVAQGVVRTIDLGIFGDKTFLNVAHIGLGSAISRDVTSAQKNYWGRFTYLRKVIERINGRRGFRATVRCGGTTRRGRWLEIAVANGQSFGGGHTIPDASPADGLLDVAAVRPRSLARLLVAWLRTRLLDAEPADNTLVSLRGQSCEVTGCRRLAVSADGEMLGHVPGTFGVLAGTLKVTVPRSPDAA